MATDPRLNNAGSPLYLRDPETGQEVEFIASRLSDRDFSEMDEWVRAQFIRTARASLGPDSTPQERDETLRIAMREASTLTWMSGYGAKLIGTIDGMARLTWQSLRRQHPRLTFEKFRAMLFEHGEDEARKNIVAENVREANRKIKELHPETTSEGKEQSAAADKREQRRRRAKKSIAR